MSYKRFINRNKLEGDYGSYTHRDMLSKGLIVGDLRRLERDQRDEFHLRRYADMTGLSMEDVKSILDIFFEVDYLPAGDDLPDEDLPAESVADESSYQQNNQGDEQGDWSIIENFYTSRIFPPFSKEKSVKSSRKISRRSRKCDCLHTSCGFYVLWSRHIPVVNITIERLSKERWCLQCKGYCREK